APNTPKPPALVTAATTSRQWLNATMGNSMPSMSATGVFIAPVSRSRSEEAWARRVRGNAVQRDRHLVDGRAHALRERRQRVQVEVVNRGGIGGEHPLELLGRSACERAPQALARVGVRALVMG